MAKWGWRRRGPVTGLSDVVVVVVTVGVNAVRPQQRGGWLGSWETLVGKISVRWDAQQQARMEWLWIITIFPSLILQLMSCIRHSLYSNPPVAAVQLVLYGAAVAVWTAFFLFIFCLLFFPVFDPGAQGISFASSFPLVTATVSTTMASCTSMKKRKCNNLPRS